MLRLRSPSLQRRWDTAPPLSARDGVGHFGLFGQQKSLTLKNLCIAFLEQVLLRLLCMGYGHFSAPTPQRQSPGPEDFCSEKSVPLVFHPTFGGLPIRKIHTKVIVVLFAFCGYWGSGAPATKPIIRRMSSVLGRVILRRHVNISNTGGSRGHMLYCVISMMQPIICPMFEHLSSTGSTQHRCALAPTAWILTSCILPEEFWHTNLGVIWNSHRHNTQWEFWGIFSESVLAAEIPRIKDPGKEAEHPKHRILDIFRSNLQTPSLHRSAKKPRASRNPILGPRNRTAGGTNSKYVWHLLLTHTVRLATSRTPSLEAVKGIGPMAINWIGWPAPSDAEAE